MIYYPTHLSLLYHFLPLHHISLVIIIIIVILHYKTLFKKIYCYVTGQFLKWISGKRMLHIFVSHSDKKESKNECTFFSNENKLSIVEERLSETFQNFCRYCKLHFTSRQL